MPYFFYGENTFLIHQKTQVFLDRFRNLPGSAESLIRLDGTSLNKEKYLEAVLATSLFSEKKLIIIKNLLSNSDTELKKYVADTLARIPETSVVVFIEEGIPDKRGLLFKALRQSKHAQEFPQFFGTELRKWIKAKVEDSGIKVSLAVLERIEQSLGSDLWRLDNEIQKYILHCQATGQKEVSLTLVESLSSLPRDVNIFSLVESIVHQNYSESVKALRSLLDQGEDEIKVLLMITSQYRQMLIVQDLLNKGVEVSAVAQKGGIHPFAVKKILIALKSYSWARLVKVYQTLQEFDLKIKTGKLEPRIALDLLIIKLAKS